MTTRKFDELTHWHQLQPVGFGQGWDPGWRADGGAFADNIGRSDPYWGMVLDKAKAAYGDPAMRYNTGDPNQDRHLVFGDGTPVPSDGSLAYRDAAHHTTYLLNDDGSVSALGANGQAGQPVYPAGYRATGDGAFAPVDPAGRQLAPLLGHPPAAPNGYHDHHGVLTPKNARGDYYIDDPATGKRGYFDTAGRPITQQQFRDGLTAAPAAPAGEALTTDEQQSGRAADAVKKLNVELKSRYSQISDAEGKLSEVLLNAHATTADGQQKLNAIQHKIVEAINNPALSLETPAGEQAFLKFLRGQVAGIGEVLKSGTLTAEDQAKAIDALSRLYAIDAGPGEPPASPTPGEADPQPAAQEPGPQPVAPGAPALQPVDLGLGPEEPMPDPTLSDLGLGGMGGPAGADPLAPLASTMPAALGAFPPPGGLGADPLSSLGGLAGAAAPLAGLASQLGEQARRDDDARADDDGDEAEQAAEDHAAADDPKSQEPKDNSGTQQPAAVAAQPEPVDSPAQSTPAGGPGAPVPATAVTLPDGSTANTRTPALAEAVKAHLAGAPVDAAYRQAGIELPPPGTPVTSPVAPSALSCGNIGMFKDHYVVALSSVKALQDGQVVPLSSVASGPDFLGWMDPSALGAIPAAPVPAPQPPPPAPVATPTG